MQFNGVFVPECNLKETLSSQIADLFNKITKLTNN